MDRYLRVPLSELRTHEVRYSPAPIGQALLRNASGDESEGPRRTGGWV